LSILEEGLRLGFHVTGHLLVILVFFHLQALHVVFDILLFLAGIEVELVVSILLLEDNDAVNHLAGHLLLADDHVHLLLGRKLEIFQALGTVHHFGLIHFDRLVGVVLLAGLLSLFFVDLALLGVHQVGLQGLAVGLLGNLQFGVE